MYREGVVIVFNRYEVEGILRTLSNKPSYEKNILGLLPVTYAKKDRFNTELILPIECMFTYIMNNSEKLKMMYASCPPAIKQELLSALASTIILTKSPVFATEEEYRMFYCLSGNDVSQTLDTDKHSCEDMHSGKNIDDDILEIYSGIEEIHEKEQRQIYKVKIPLKRWIKCIDQILIYQTPEFKGSKITKELSKKLNGMFDDKMKLVDLPLR